ncbi:DUF6155 family protein [Paracrocinitomix mangrovi]|uniref:DUF6155 family protein n=1 Tax=Paracrocinitomix mangrovi TaxID=2862509 RepID=UPI001C8E3F94|nr:DUF6155 family protein [Paracrocinitomix mangrovi]UKN02410.1 DUF6155 family protein [Paracrocinitomix mangrovi]
MSKRKLKSYLQELSKEELEEQILELHDRLKEVKEFYDFVFNPNENKRVEEAKFKIGKEYFPPSNRKAKKRRSVAQKFIKEFVKLGMEPILIADIMLYNVEIVLAFTAETTINQDAFYKSMLKSFEEAVDYIDKNGLQASCNPRIEKIIDQVYEQNWINKSAFENVMMKRIN